MSDQTPQDPQVPATPEPTASQPVAATPPAATPPVATAPAATPPAGGANNSSKQKTIMMIVAGVIGIGAIGGIVGFMAGGDKDEPKTPINADGGSGILNPTPISNDPTPAPTPTSTEPTPQPTDAPPPPPPPGDGVQIGNITVALPDGWEVLGQGDTDVLMGDGDSSWVYAITGLEDPSTDAAALLGQVVNAVLPAENYSQLQLGQVNSLQPFGSIVSIAEVDYDALWVDTQGSLPLYGQMYVGIRQDGTSLIMTVEHSPPKEFEASRPSWAPVIDQSFSNFGAS